MEIINTAVKIIAVLWGLCEMFLFMMTGCDSFKQDKGSFLILVMILGFLIQIGIPCAIANQVTGFGYIKWGYPFVSYTGFFLIFIGVIVQAKAIYTLKQQFSTVVKTLEKHKLIDYGIYSYVRHPIYSAVLLIWIGFGVALANWVYTLLFFSLLLIGFTYRIIIEEKVLREYFGDEYVQYGRRTKRLIPGIF